MKKLIALSTIGVLILWGAASANQPTPDSSNKVERFNAYRLLWRYLKNELKDRRLTIPPLKDVMSEIGMPTQKALNPNSIKFLVWNMYKGEKPDWERDFHYLSEGKDILVLQEMYMSQTMDRVFNNHSDYHYKLATSFIYKEGNVRTGLATAAKVEPNKFFFQRSKVLEPVINTPKMSLFTLYPIQGMEKELMVVNIHAINFVSTWGLAQQIKDIVKILKDYHGPAVFAGDFNTWSEDKVRYVKHQMNRLGMTEVKFDPDTRMRTFKRPLDYVFVKGLKIKSSKVWGELDGSDHKALDVELAIQ